MGKAWDLYLLHTRPHLDRGASTGAPFSLAAAGGGADVARVADRSSWPLRELANG
jgi:hypothetical protein